MLDCSWQSEPIQLLEAFRIRSGSFPETKRTRALLISLLRPLICERPAHATTPAVAYGFPTAHDEVQTETSLAFSHTPSGTGELSGLSSSPRVWKKRTPLTQEEGMERKQLPSPGSPTPWGRVSLGLPKLDTAQNSANSGLCQVS